MIAGRYTLEREIGRGGMGSVWMARDEMLGRPVAMKRLHVLPGVTAAVEERAMREARVSAMLNHPNVVGVYDVASDGDDHWLVMEYVDSQNVAALVREHGPLGADIAAGYAVQAASALSAAHRAGIVHRDVKPSNLLVTPDGRVKLSDFGIARSVGDASVTQTGMVTGSPAFLAPEVASGRPVTDACDVWSLGATIWHMVEGHPPYHVGDNLMGALYKIVNEEPPRAANAGWLATFLAGTMNRSVEDRWSMEQAHRFLAEGPGGSATTRPVDVPGRRDGVGDAGDDAVTGVLPASAPAAADGTGTPAEPARSETGERRGRGPRTPAVIALVALLVAAVVGAFYIGFRDDGSTTAGSPDPSASSSTPGRSPTPSPSPTPSESPTEQKSKKPKPPPPEANAADMRAFTDSYVQTAVNDPSAGWPMLTPEFQSASGGFEGYQGWWSTVSSAELSNISASPSDMTVSYDVHYTMVSGVERDESVQLLLDHTDGEYRVAGEG